MATLQELQQALIAADKAGATEDARALAAAILKVKGANAPSPVAPTPEFEPEDPGFGKTLLIGAGRTFDRIGKGMQQMYYGATGNEAAQAKLKQEADSDDVYYEALRQKRPFATGIGESLPSTILAGAGAPTLLGNAVRMGVTTAVPAALEYGSVGDRLQKGIISGGTAAAIPVAAAALKAGHTMVQPFYRAGRDKIAGRALNRVAGDDAAEVISRLRNAEPLVPDSLPTAAQVAENGGIAAFERMAKQADPTAYTQRAMEQANARIGALRSIAGDEGKLRDALILGNAKSKEAYKEAFKESVEVTPELSRLAGRPSMKKAESRAIDLADELGIPFQARLADMRSKYVPVDRNVTPSMINTLEVIPGKSIPLGLERAAPSSVLEAPKADSLGMLRPSREVRVPGDTRPAFFDLPEVVTPKTVRVQPDSLPQAYMEIPPVQSVPVRDMHTLKMAMDALLQDQSIGIAGREAAAVKGTRERLLNMLPESYQAARLGHIENMKPANQMQIGQELLKKLQPALADFGQLGAETKATFATAMRNADQLAEDAIGIRGTTLASVMTPEQLGLLTNIGRDLARKSNAETLGKDIGSDTFQKLAMANIAEQSGVPRITAGLLELPVVSKVTKLLYEGADEKAQKAIAEALLDPKKAADLMEGANKGWFSPAVTKLIQQSAFKSGGLLGTSFPAATGLLAAD